MNYLLSASLLLLVLWPAYYALLRYSDRYVLNRFLILLGLAAVCALPCVSFDSPAPGISQSVQTSIKSIESSTRTSQARALPPVQSNVEEAITGEMVTSSIPVTNDQATEIDYWQTGYLIGAGLLGLILFFRLLSLLTMHLRSRRHGSYRVLSGGNVSGQAFTFGTAVYVSPELPADSDFHHVLAHEKIHARQLHSLDILFSELILCLFWFHPAAWWLRAQLRANLEYLVDKQIVLDGGDKRDYQLALVRQSQGTQHLALSLPFSEPTLRGRISRLTGMEEHNVITWLAAAALLFWGGVATLVIIGTTTGDTNDYLAASTDEQDPYYELYEKIIPEEIKAIQLITDRMLTGDEFLRLRAIIARVPGTEIFVYQNAFDDGPSIEFRSGRSMRAAIHNLSTSGNSLVKQLTLEKLTDTESEAVSVELMNFNYELGSNMPVELSSPFAYLLSALILPNSEEGFILDITSIRDSLSGGPQLYVNSKLVSLEADLPGSRDRLAGKVVVKGRDITLLNRDEWVKVKVEGYARRDPQERIAIHHGLEDWESEFNASQSFRKNKLAYNATWGASGTYRAWVESFGFRPTAKMSYYYNHRSVTEDFILDQAFGANSMIQALYDVSTNNKVTIQVLDDYPVISNYIGLGSRKSPVLDNKTHELDIYFKRFPTPNELNFIRQYLTEFPGYELRLYHSCTDRPGHLTLSINKSDEMFSGYGDWEPGIVLSRPNRVQLQRFGNAGKHSTLFGQVQWPKDAPNGNIILNLDGKWIVAPEAEHTDFDINNLDQPVHHESLRCKIWYGRDYDRSIMEWTYQYRDTGPFNIDAVIAVRDANDFQDRPMIFYINENPVGLEEFNTYQGTQGSYIQVGTLMGTPDAALVSQIIDY